MKECGVYFSARFSWTSPLSDRKVPIAMNVGLIDSVLLTGAMFLLASHVNVRRASSRVPPPRTKSKKVYACVEAMILGRGGGRSSEQKLHVFHVRTDHKTLALQEATSQIN